MDYDVFHHPKFPNDGMEISVLRAERLSLCLTDGINEIHVFQQTLGVFDIETYTVRRLTRVEVI